MADKLRISFNGDQLGRQYTTGFSNMSKRYQSAFRGTLQEAEREIHTRVNADISSAGNFGPRWTKGFKSSYATSNDGQQLVFTHDIPYFMVHQRGATIHGKPMLWIPLSFGRAAELGVRARDFPGGLFRVDRKGGKAPLLLSFDGEPQYFGKASVRIPKRFHVLEIIRDVSKQIKTMFAARVKGKK